jgi:hypothetical protein
MFGWVWLVSAEFNWSGKVIAGGLTLLSGALMLKPQKSESD